MMDEKSGSYVTNGQISLTILRGRAEGMSKEIVKLCHNWSIQPRQEPKSHKYQQSGETTEGEGGAAVKRNLVEHYKA